MWILFLFLPVIIPNQHLTVSNVEYYSSFKLNKHVIDGTYLFSSDIPVRIATLANTNLGKTHCYPNSYGSIIKVKNYFNEDVQLVLNFSGQYEMKPAYLFLIKQELISKEDLNHLKFKAELGQMKIYPSEVTKIESYVINSKEEHSIKVNELVEKYKVKAKILPTP